MSIRSLQPRLAEAGATWLEAALADVERRPDALAQHFSAVSRRCGRDPLSDDDPQGLRHGCIDDAARSLLMGALALRGADRANLLDDLYRHGDAGEKRGVLRGLRRLDEPGKPGERDTPGEPGGIGAALLPIVEDALRTNDVRLVAAAVQGYGARYLGQEAYRHAVVKCVFTGIPLGAIANLADRQDAELARMLVDLAHERTAAGRDIPTDIHAVVGAFPQALDRPDLSVDLLSALLPATHVYKE